MIGLLTGNQFRISFSILITVCSLILIIIFILTFKGLTEVYKIRWLFGSLVYFFLFFSGILLFESRSYDLDRIAAHVDDSRCFIGKVISKPQKKNKTVKLILRIISYKDSDMWYKCNTKTQAYIQKNYSSGKLAYGDIIIIKTALRHVKGPENPCEFNYKKLLQYKGIIRESYIKSRAWKLIGRANNLLTYSQNLRSFLLELYKKYGFENDEFAVLSALTLGYRDELGAELKKSFSSAGVMHILAVSGLHTGIIFYVLNIVFGFLQNVRYGKTIKLLLVILALWFYALLTGASISVVRASAMFSLINLGSYMRRMINIYNILAALAFFLLIFNPYQVFDVGFQLSFLAVLSIVFLQPRLYSLFTFRNCLTDRIWMLFTVSISAQAGIFPVVIYYFHHFPLYFWLTNILILPIVAVVIFLAILLYAFSPVYHIAHLIAELLNVLLKAINFLVNEVRSLPFSLIEGIYNSFTETVLLYAIIFSLSVYIIFRKRIFSIICLFCIICFLSVNLYRKYNIYMQKEIVIFSVNEHTVLSFVYGRHNLLVTDSNAEINDNILSGLAHNYRDSHGTYYMRNKSIGELTMNKLLFDANNRISCRSLFGNPVFNFCGERILLLCDTHLLEYKGNNKFRVDYIIITGDLMVNICRITGLFDFKQIIVDSSNDFRTQEYWKDMCKANGINTYIISETGAFISKL